MICRTGIDIVEIGRIEKAVARWDDPFLRRVFTDAELERYRRSLPSLAARFAAKEAVMKMLCADGIRWHDIEVLSGLNGQPALLLHGRARDQANRLGLTDIAISLSHSRDLAIASVVGVGGDGRNIHH